MLSPQGILIITQKVDQEDPILGFFHGWITGLAAHYENVTVICLERGTYQLPSNVTVLSLGKEDRKSRLRYITRLYGFLWRQRHVYQTIFVHMNQEYILLGGLLWKLLGKRVYLWRNHKKGTSLTRLAVVMADRVFCTSPESYTAKFKKTILMPVGIDTDIFKPDEAITKIPRSILALGRISPVKRLDILIDALLDLTKKNVVYTATIVGSPTNRPEDIEYEHQLKSLAEPLVQTGRLTFQKAIAPAMTPDVFRRHELYINLTPAGSMDKTIFEAMACGTMVVVDNTDTVAELADRLAASLNLSEADKVKKRKVNCQLVETRHSLNLLLEKLVKIFKE